MLRIDRGKSTLRRLKAQPIADAGLKERVDIQRMIRQSADDFFAELGERVLLIGEEVRPVEFVDDRIDLLALDEQGAAVVIEIKRDYHKLQLLQALAYSAMVSRWDRSRLVEERSRLVERPIRSVEDELDQFLLEESSDLNDTQRVILLAEDFDYEVLVTAEWLTEKYGVDVRCYRLALSIDGDEEFLACSCIYPPREISQHAIPRKRIGNRPVKWLDWATALQEVDNAAVRQFFEQEIAAGRENYLRRRILRYRVADKRRWHVMARQERAYVWQVGRFAEDEEFWRKRLGEHADVKPVKQGRCLRFFLTSDDDCRNFAKVYQNSGGTIAFSDAEGDGEAKNEAE
jgi:hypothetical protein